MPGGKYGDKSNDNTRVQGVDPSTGNPDEITRSIDGTRKRLDVDANISGINSPINLPGSKCYYDDMNVANGGVARNTLVTNSSWTKVYEYSGGSGFLFFMNLTLEDHEKWQVRLVVDGHEVFGANGISTADLNDTQIYNLNFNDNDKFAQLFANVNIGIGKNDTFFWSGPVNYPVHYDSSVKIYVKRLAGEGSKRFRAGLITLQKD